MKKLFLALSVIALTGCGGNGYNYRVDQEIVASYTTSKSVTDTQECILGAWQSNNVAGYGVMSQKVGKYYSVFGGLDNADLFEENGKTKINFYSVRGSMDPWRGIKKRTDGIKSCL